MNTTIRHLLTFLAGLGAILAAKGLIPAEQTEAVNEAGGKLVEPLTVVIGAVAAVLMRWVIAAVQKLFGKAGKADGPGLFLHPVTMILAGLMVLAGVTLAGCTSVETDAKGGVVKRTEFNPPPAVWELLGQALGRKNATPAPVVDTSGK